MVVGTVRHDRRPKTARNRGNATIRSIRSDFARLRIDSITLSTESTDTDHLHVLMRFRNAVSHGDAKQLGRIVDQGLARDDLAWAGGRLRTLHRLALGLDRSVWDHFHETTGEEPW